MKIKVGQVYRYRIGSKPFYEKITAITNSRCYYEIIASKSPIFSVGEADDESIERYEELIYSLEAKLINNFNDYYNAV